MNTADEAIGYIAFLLLALSAEMEHTFTAERAAPAHAVAEAKDRRIGRPLARRRQLREHIAGRFAVTAGIAYPGTGSGRGTVTPTGHAKPSCVILVQGSGTVSSRTPRGALEGTAGRVGVSHQACEEDPYGSDDAVHDRGRRNLCRWSPWHGEPRREGKGAIDVADGRPPFWPRVPLALHRGAVTRHG